jgi:di/tricarboxylate transporter
MTALALILVIATAVWVGGVLAASSDSDFGFFGLERSLSTSEVFLIGIVTGIVIMIVLWLLLVAIRRDRRFRQEHRELERRRDELEQEKVKIDEELGHRVDDAPSEPPSRFDP